MPKPLKDYVKQVLAEHDRGDKIREAFDYTIKVVKEMPLTATCRRKSTIRAIFWEIAVAKLIELTAGDPGLHRVDHHDTVSFIFDQAVLVRLKKASMSLHTSNYPTPTATLFDDHDADLFGFTGIQRVEAVYIPNRFESAVIWSGIVAHDIAGSELWHFEFEAPTVAPTATIPVPVHPPAGDLAKIKTHAKGTKKKPNENGG